MLYLLLLRKFNEHRKQKFDEQKSMFYTKVGFCSNLFFCCTRGTNSANPKGNFVDRIRGFGILELCAKKQIARLARKSCVRVHGRHMLHRDHTHGSEQPERQNVSLSTLLDLIFALDTRILFTSFDYYADIY